MSKRMIAVAALFLQNLAPAAGLAANPYEEGVRFYNARQYKAAAEKFQQAAQSAPANQNIRYYLGLSYQGMNQNTLARQQYQWVATAGTGQIKSMAVTALRNLADRTSPGSGNTVPVAVAAGKKASTPDTSSGASQVRGRLKVLDFYTVWCGPCKRFEPIFDAVASRMRGQVEFKRIDAEEDSNRSLVEKYQIDRYPTVIYTDDTGKVLYRGSSESSEEDFERTIHSVLGK